MTYAAEEYHGWSPLLVVTGLVLAAGWAVLAVRVPRLAPRALQASSPGLTMVLLGLFVDRGKAVVVSLALGVPAVTIGAAYLWARRRDRASQPERRSVPS